MDCFWDFLLVWFGSPLFWGGFVVVLVLGCGLVLGLGLVLI